MDLKTQTSFEDLAANDTKRISVAIVAHGGQLWLARPIDLLPIEHQRLFGESGTYVITLQVSSETAPPCQAVVEIVAMAADPVVSGLSKAKGSISLLKA
jgi:hypothetical protein